MRQITPIFRSEAFDPETLVCLADSHERAMHILRQTGELRDKADQVSELLARRIIELAGRGERDPLRLTVGALKFIRAK